jgi:tetratricopeptide (TPR) repeat protein
MYARPKIPAPLLGALFVSAMSLAPAVRAAEDPVSAATKAQAAFFARDAAGLSQLAAATTPWAKSTNPRELYAHAYVQFRTQQVALLSKRESDSEKAGEACIAATDAAIKRDPKFAEAHALQSSCYGYLAGLGGFGAIRNGTRSGKAVEAALALEPKNPRVMLTDAFGLYVRPKIAGGDKVKGCVKFREAAAAFDAAGTAASAPGMNWGAAEAHYWVGRCASETGNAAAARPSYEKALALAPDFVAARKALGR